MANSTLYVSCISDPRGLATITVNSVYGLTTERVSYYVMERGAGAPIWSAGGQRGDRRTAGPFASRDEAETAMAQSHIIQLRPQVFGSFSREDLDTMVEVEWYQRPGNANAEEQALMDLRADGIAWLDAHPSVTHVQIEDGEIVE